MAWVFDKSLKKGAHIGFQSKRSVRYFESLTDVVITYNSNSNIKTSCYVVWSIWYSKPIKRSIT